MLIDDRQRLTFDDDLAPDFVTLHQGQVMDQVIVDLYGLLVPIQEIEVFQIGKRNN